MRCIKIKKIMVNIEERVELARKYHNEGYNCAQSVVMAYSDLLPIEKNIAETLSLPFGRGLAGFKEVCGCVSAMSLLAGMLLQYQKQNPVNKDYFAIVQTMGEKFREENGEIVCKKLLGLEPGSTKAKKPCNDYVACAARIVGENLLK